MHPSCCCCYGNIRHLVLLLTSICITVLFANVVLFSLTTILHDETEFSQEFRTVPSIVNLHESTGRLRFRRVADNSSVDTGDRIVHESNVRDANTSGKEDIVEEDAHPIVTQFISDGTTTTPTTSTSTEITSKDVRVVFFTNSPITPRETRNTQVIPTPTESIVSNHSREVVNENLYKIQKEPKPTFVYSESLVQYILRSSLYSAPGLGILAGTWPATSLLKQFGSRKTLSLALLSSALFTLTTPLLVSCGFLPLFLIRFLIGVCFSSALPVAGCVTANWGRLNEQLTFIAVNFLFISGSPIFSWNFAMFIYSNDVPIKYIYISHSVVSVLCAVAFFIFHRDRPQYHNWVNGIELNKIVAGKVQELKNNRLLSNPFGTLLRSISVWAIWLTMFGFFTIVTVFHTFLPTFFSATDVWLVDYIGLYGALPFLGIPVFYLLSFLANRSICCNSTIQVRIWNSISFALTAVFVIILPILFLSGEEGASRNFLLILTLSPLGLVMAGAMRSATLVGRFYTQHILSYLGFFLGAAMTITPYVVLRIVKFNNLSEWIKVFFFAAIMLTLFGVGFAVFGRGRSSGWAEYSWNPEQVSKMRTLDPIDMAYDECGIYEMRLIDAKQDVN